MGDDNTPSNGTIIFSPGVLLQAIIIPSVYLKLNRRLTVLLSGAPTRVTLSPSQATVTITEDNGRWDIVVVCMLSKLMKIMLLVESFLLTTRVHNEERASYS